MSISVAMRAKLLASFFVLSTVLSNLSLLPFSVEKAYAAAPLCNGLTATIYVEAGFVVGGPNDGLAYTPGVTVLLGTAGADVISGTADGDIITAGNGANTICGEGGNDTITAGINADTVITGTGDDTIDVSNGTNTITDAGGTNDITTGNGGDTITVSGTGDNMIDSGPGTDTITTGDGDDTILGGNGDNVIDAGNGDNNITTGINGDMITTGTGDDTIDASNGTNTVTDAGGNNDITTGNGGDTITVSGTGDNVVDAGPGNDSVTTGGGDDQITAGNGTNTVNAGAGDDIITGGINADTFDGEAGNDACLPSTGTNTVSNCEETTHGTIVIVKDTNPDDAQDFDFTLDTSGFATSKVFTLDDDADGTLSNTRSFPKPVGTYVATESAVAGWSVTNITCVDPDSGTTTGSSLATIDLDDGETVTCTFVNEVVAPTCNGQTATIYVDGSNMVVGGPLNGTVFAGTLTGTSGNDVIVGTTGNDTITGENGNDLICSLAGEDTISGNGGSDEIYGGNDDDTINGNGGADELYGQGGNDTIRGQNNPDTIYGGNGDDTIEGGNGGDTLRGQADNDTINGGNGNDIIEGAAGEDTISGGPGLDDISGGNDNDTITGDGDNDTIHGNGGDDMLCGNDGNDIINGGTGEDTICGGEGDDTINGQGDDDQIDGNEGNDTVNGGAGTDICVNSEGLTSCEDTGTPVLACQKGFTLDYGDAEDPMYPTLFANDGARHKVTSVFLGASIDDDADGQQSAGADGDDTDGTDDEDGVEFGMWMAGEMGTGTVTASAGGFLDAWADFNDDGDWDDADEHIIDDLALSAGSNSFIFPVPSASHVGDVVTRFRFASTTISSYTGLEEDGEVEDYLVAVSMPHIPKCNGLSATIYVDGNNKIVGGPDNGNTYAGILNGTTGDDVIVGTSNADTINGDDGDDTICGKQGNDEINGGADADDLYGNGGKDTIKGNGGGDTIYGGNGDDDLRGNGGDDEIYGEDGEDTIKGGNGEDIIEGGKDKDDIEGGDGDDHISGNGGKDTIKGDAGADEIYGGNGDDTLRGNGGKDEIYGDDGDDDIKGGNGDDYIEGGKGKDDIEGGDDNDEIYGNGGKDTIKGDGGADTIYGGKGDDELRGNGGKDEIRGGDGEDEIYGGNGADFLCGDNDDDYIEGGNGDDTICGSTGDDELYGNDGDDQIDGGENSDTIDGGADTDICVNGETVTTCEDTSTPVILCEDKAACLPDDTSLVGYWRFDESSGASTAVDSSGNGNDGTYDDPKQSTDVTSLTYGNMFSRDFDGADDVVTVPSSSTLSFDTGDAFSGFAWVNADSFATFQAVLQKIDDGTQGLPGYMFVLNNGNPELWLINSFPGTYIRAEASGVLLPSGVWKHIGFSYDGSGTAAGVTFYVDGVAHAANVLSDTLSGSIVNTANFEMGGRSVGNVQFFDGKIDDVRVFSREFTETQAAELAGGQCEDSGAISATVVTQTTGGIHGVRYAKQRFIQKLNNFTNPNNVNSPIAPGSFGGPTSFVGDESLTWEELNSVCTIHDNLGTLTNYDIIEYMAENFARAFGVSEEFILDIIQNGTYCEFVFEARANEVARQEAILAQEEAERYAAELAAIEARKPKPIEFAVAEDGFPVSSDMIWNACIRNFEVFMPGESKPINCRRFHEGHTWTHPDTLVTFDFTNRFSKKISVRNHLVATFTVPNPSFYVQNFTVVNNHIVSRYVLPVAQYLAQKGKDFYDEVIVREEEIETVVLGSEVYTTSIDDINNVVLSEETTIEQ